jgi:putative transposase
MSSVADSNFGEIRRQLEYKTQRHGIHLVTIDRFTPSSKTCSGCKYVKPELKLSERVFICEECGMVMDRDLNAAINIKRVAMSSIDTQNACGQKSAGFLATGSETVLEEAGTIQHCGLSINV